MPVYRAYRTIVTASVTHFWKRGAVSRTARLLELLVRVQSRPRFTSRELAEEFGVSRRTILRDMAVLTDMGVPLRSTSGPGGGYSLPRGGRRLSPTLTVDEALALIVSYEALLRYPVSPFSEQSVSAVTKLRSALPADVVGELDDLREHVAVVEPVRDYDAPLLGDLLRAAVDGAHLQVSYDSIRSGTSERVIFPFGVYASEGFWYCACHDYRREMNVALRADRFLAFERLEGSKAPPRPQHISLRNWTRKVRGDPGEKLKLRLRVSERAAKSFELVSLFGPVGVEGEGRDVVEARIPRSEIEYYASHLLSVGTEVQVESPPELVLAVREKALEIARLYD
jgi:predicted DNA-binding transcriptional regulator YafY